MFPVVKLPFKVKPTIELSELDEVIVVLAGGLQLKTLGLGCALVGVPGVAVKLVVSPIHTLRF